jgi:hypothetical protein
MIIAFDSSPLTQYCDCDGQGVGSASWFPQTTALLMEDALLDFNASVTSTDTSKRAPARRIGIPPLDAN